MYDEQRSKIVKLLETAQSLANDLQEPDLSYLIERAIDQCRASFTSRSKLAVAALSAITQTKKG